MTDIDDLEHALAESWGSDTSADPSGWHRANPAWGQCAVTALVVQDYFGGDLLRSMVGEVSHYYNLLPGSRQIDLTFRQFGHGAVATAPEQRARDYVIGYPATARRYQILAARTRDHLSRQHGV